jgi:hypothetical protein
LTIDGTTTPVTARLGDRFQNPAPDGTAITFTAEGGNILSQCTTTTTASEGGVCTVNFRSSNPRPSDGRITLLAKAIGEESFVDTNGNGAFDAIDSFTDTAEPFRDDNENGAYDLGEDFFDFNNDQDRDLPDAIFNGVLCNSAGECDSNAQSTGIAEQNKIILSGSSPDVTLPGGGALPASIAVGALNSAVGVSFWVRDVNDNVMPGGTTVALSVSGGGLGVSLPSAFTVPCSAIAAGVEFPGITVFSFTVTSGGQAGSGVLTLTVTTPSGLISIRQMNVTAP